MLNQNMVSYYNTLAMFPSHHAHHHPAHRQAHPSAAAAAAYFAAGYGGYAAPQHQPFNIGTPPHHTHYAHHPHHQFAAAVQAAATQAHHSTPGSPGPTGLGDLAACNGGANSSSLGLTPSPGLENPCSSPPTSTSLQTLHQHGSSGFGQQQQQQQQFSEGLSGLGSSPPAASAAWHNATPPPIYSSTCVRHFDDQWPSSATASQPPPPPLLGPVHSPGSPTGSYKFSSTLEFQQGSHQCPPPPPPPLQQPQDLSALGGGGGSGAGGQHPSPDSGLAGSSDGVSSSAGSPQLQLSSGPHQLGGHHVTGVRPPNPRSPYEWMKKPSYHNQPNPVGNLLEGGLSLQDAPGKTRTKDKYRVVYSDHQRLELEKEFHYSRYITIRRKSELAATLGLSERQNRRAKERKQTKKREEIMQKEKMEVAVQMQQHHQQQLAGGAVVM
ncbi:hypothetical protein B566_EDAN001238 [Ephemera danica]|nr:hypothetical protein B566_EDAN001238 [Ephemera danica]